MEKKSKAKIPSNKEIHKKALELRGLDKKMILQKIATSEKITKQFFIIRNAMKKYKDIKGTNYFYFSKTDHNKLCKATKELIKLWGKDI